MKKVTITYKNTKTLQALEAMSKYFGFTLSTPIESKEKVNFQNNASIIPGNSAIDISELNSIFSGKNIDAAELRKTAWQRRK
jgi:hypothetical protein